MSDSNERAAQVQSLENGKGLQYLVNEAYKILGNPILLHNMEYELLVCTENVVTDDRLWNEIVENGVFNSASINFFMEECFIDIVASTKSVALLTSDKLKYERLYGRVFNCYKNTVADLIMMACDRPLEEQDADAFAALCEKMSQEISAIDFFRGYGINYHQKLIYELLGIDIGDKFIYSDHLANLYEELKANIYVVVVDIGECNISQSKLEEYRDLFKEMQPEYKYAVYSNYVMVIAGTDESELNVEKDLCKLNGYFLNNGFRIGISSCFDNLFNLREHYNEAVTLLNQGI